MTENDKLFLGTLLDISAKNKTKKKEYIVTNKALLSKELLDLFGVESASQGCWIGNVYVQFKPMYETRKAEDWMKEDA